ncbi:MULTISPECIES: hypothetical protein [Yersinia]|uniref:Uncharacterized protein n=1 Tax=Yersinia frederiksenii TaxID=29484 RepID=A0AAI8ZNB3_YERFR|nr:MULTISPECIES: hypothetical protein [Yersinia]MDN0126857.1 hypothetical protein [Yersinia massiliensis]CFQ88065.1 Uncharacterised protein [Yersinia frederiksenii]
MDAGSLQEIEREYNSAITNSRIGLYILCAGVLLIVGKFIWGISGSSVLFGIVAGGGGVYWGMLNDKASKLKLKLDEICYSKYGKPYDQSFTDITNDRYPPKS